MKKKWFAVKKYGWGWYPVSWQGWLLLSLYVIWVVFRFRQIDRLTHSASDTLLGFMPELALVTGALVLISYLSGEEPGWRWGGKKIKLKLKKK